MKTLLLCFIHGFRGDEETFYGFPSDLQHAVSKHLPDIAVETAVYPRYDTKGDLALAVQAFREWLQEKVGDLERKSESKSPIYDPTVNVIIIAHSMGGFVAADALFETLDDRPISPDPNIQAMFPTIKGLLAFDTPYNGLSRSMFAYGAFSQYNNLSSIWNLASTVSSISAAPAVATAEGWKSWQLIAARTGTAGMIVAGGVAAYTNKERIRQGLASLNKDSLSQGLKYINKDNLSQGLSYISWNSIGAGFAWTSSHLKFVGALLKPSKMKMRLERLNNLEGIGRVDFYTSLGENGYWTGGYLIPKRTFCAIPPEKAPERRLFIEQANPKASNEVEAHCSMFRPIKNPAYNEMVDSASRIMKIWANEKRRVIDNYKPNKEQEAQGKVEEEQINDDGVSQIDEEEGDEGELFRKALGVPLPPDTPADDKVGDGMFTEGASDEGIDQESDKIKSLDVGVTTENSVELTSASEEEKQTEDEPENATDETAEPSGDGKPPTTTGRLFQGISKIGTLGSWTGLTKKKT